MKTCEHCMGIVQGMGHSSVIVLQKVDRTGYQFYQCENGQEVDFHTWQHWHCSHEHMKTNLHKCIDTHYTERSLHQPEAGNVVNLHTAVLRMGLHCAVCDRSLDVCAYRFVLTMATPYNKAYHTGDEEAWCCSFEHAQQFIHNVVDTLERA